MAENLLIIFTGESNSGASAFNSDALASEIEQTSTVKIWDNVNMDGFDDLKISNPDSNNVLSHAGLEDSVGVGHSWELELSNQVKDGKLQSPVYLVKCGQGGSVVANWQSASAYWTTMKARVDGAIAALASLNGYTNKIYIFLSLGINDAIASTNAATFKTNYSNFLANMNTRYSPQKILGTYIPQNNTTYLGINEKILELGNELSYFDTIPITGAALRVDNIHWAYEGAKIIARRMLNNIKYYNVQL